MKQQTKSNVINALLLGSIVAIILANIIVLAL